MSGTNYDEQNFAGGSTGNSPTSQAGDWASVTLNRPTARQAMNGKRPHIIKTVSLKVCGKDAKRKIKVRVSAASGSPYDDSYTATISWQKAATTLYRFGGINMAFADSGSMRVWIVSGGNFLFNRNSGASTRVVTDSGKQFSGGFVGSFEFSQVANAPTAPKIARDKTTPTTITASWKKPSDIGAPSLMGYRVQVASNSTFTADVRSIYVSDTNMKQYGFSTKKRWWLRVAARNEVSEKFDLPGGVWSSSVSLPTYVDPGTPDPVDPGTDPAAGDSGDADNTDPVDTSPTENSGGSSDVDPDAPVATTPSTPAKPVVVYTPIPDTSSTETRFGGLLLSKSPAKATYHAYVYDRGGRRRIGKLKSFTRLKWGRVRDDISEALIDMTAVQAAESRTVLNKTYEMRHELVIFRGKERVWEGPITYRQDARSGVHIQARDVMHWAQRTVMRGAYSNAYPNVDYVVARAAGIFCSELARKEALTPPINVVPWLKTYIEEGDARTSRATLGSSMYLFDHVDDLAAKAGMDYTVVGRAVHMWDTSRAALGRTRVVSEDDFTGDPAITAYGSELATVYTVTDGQGAAATAGAVDPFYGEIELLATAYDETGTSVSDEDATTTTVSQEELLSQARRGVKGRSPVPLVLSVPENSAFDITRGIGLDVLVPGVYIPVRATLSNRTIATTMKLKSVDVLVDDKGEHVSVTMSPASTDDSGQSGDVTLDDTTSTNVTPAPSPSGDVTTGSSNTADTTAPPVTQAPEPADTTETAPSPSTDPAPPPVAPPVDTSPVPSYKLWNLEKAVTGKSVSFTPASPNVMQSVARSESSGEWYVTQAVNGSNGKRDPYESTLVNRISANGALLDSMLLVDAGHGTSLGVEDINGNVALWVNWQKPQTGGQQYDLMRVPYRAGSYTRSTARGTVPFPGGFNSGVRKTDISFDFKFKRVVVRVGYGAYDQFDLYDLTDFLAQKKTKIAGAQTIKLAHTHDNVPTPVMQGYTTYGDALFHYTGIANGVTAKPSDPPAITEYQWQTGKQVSKLDTRSFGRNANGTYPGNSYEPEGLSSYTGGDGRLYAGVVLNTQANRQWQVYAIKLAAL